MHVSTRRIHNTDMYNLIYIIIHPRNSSITFYFDMNCSELSVVNKLDYQYCTFTYSIEIVYMFFVAINLLF